MANDGAGAIERVSHPFFLEAGPACAAIGAHRAAQQKRRVRNVAEVAKADDIVFMVVGVSAI